MFKQNEKKSPMLDERTLTHDASMSRLGNSIVRTVSRCKRDSEPATLPSVTFINDDLLRFNIRRRGEARPSRSAVSFFAGCPRGDDGGWEWRMYEHPCNVLISGNGNRWHCFAFQASRAIPFHCSRGMRERGVTKLYRWDYQRLSLFFPSSLSLSLSCVTRKIIRIRCDVMLYYMHFIFFAGCSSASLSQYLSI